nr:hypothetical protein Itr_chr10CG12660 [Ipomoea trifida]
MLTSSRHASHVVMSRNHLNHPIRHPPATCSNFSRTARGTSEPARRACMLGGSALGGQRADRCTSGTSAAARRPLFHFAPAGRRWGAVTTPRGTPGTLGAPWSEVANRRSRR